MDQSSEETRNNMKAENKATEDGKSSNDRQSVQSRKSLWIIGITIVMSVAALDGIIGLQSSVNVEEGLGTTSVMIVYIASSISCIVFVPFVIDFYGARTAIILGEIGLMAYVAANFYPHWYTIIVASIIHGLMESAPYAGAAVYVSFLGERRWEKRRKYKSTDSRKSKDTYILTFLGRFNALLYMGGIAWNSLGSLILNAFEVRSLTTFQNDTSADNFTVSVTYQPNTSVTTVGLNQIRNLAKCGANDCQQEYIYNGTEEELEKFNPNPRGIYTFFGLFIVMTIAAIIVQVTCLPYTPSKFDTINENINTKRNKSIKQVVTSYKICQEIRAVFVHLASPLRLLVTPLTFYCGMFFAYSTTEYTRAFVSCTVGVEQVGLAFALLSLSAVLSSVLTPKVTHRFGRKPSFIVLGSIHFVIYLLELLWVPSENQLWVVYMIGALTGVGEGFATTFLQGLTSHYFEDKLGIAFSADNLIINLGIVAAAGWSTRFCVYEKIYIHLGVLTLAILCLFGAEFLHIRKKRTATNTVPFKVFSISKE